MHAFVALSVRTCVVGTCEPSTVKCEGCLIALACLSKMTNRVAYISFQSRQARRSVWNQLHTRTDILAQCHFENRKYCSVLDVGLCISIEFLLTLNH